MHNAHSRDFVLGVIIRAEIPAISPRVRETAGWRTDVGVWEIVGDRNACVVALCAPADALLGYTCRDAIFSSMSPSTFHEAIVSSGFAGYNFPLR